MFFNRLKKVANNIIDAKSIYWLGVMLVVTLIGVVSKYSLGEGEMTGINNYYIYKGVFEHLCQNVTLYGPYPDQYMDMNHYGILFGIIIAPFSLLPDFWGLLLWMTGGVLLLYYAISELSIERRYKNLIILLTIPELYLSIAYQQFSIALIGLVILSFVYVERGKNLWATLLIAIGTFVKIYALGALAFFFFTKRKWSFVGYFALWCVVLFALPMFFGSPEYVVGQYADWYEALAAKSQSNMFSMMQNISILGFIRKSTQSANYSDIWIMGSGLLLFLLPYLRLSQYKNYDFRLMFLASVLLFLTLFSSGSESCSYLMAMIGVLLWFAATPYGRTSVAIALMVLCFLSCIAINILPPELYHSYFRTYALKSLPFMAVWLRIIYEMLRCDYGMLKFENNGK